MTSACNREKYQLVILFGRTKHLKVSLILFMIFYPKSQAKVLFLKNEKRWLDFTIEVSIYNF